MLRLVLLVMWMVDADGGELVVLVLLLLMMLMGEHGVRGKREPFY